MTVFKPSDMFTVDTFITAARFRFSDLQICMVMGLMMKREEDDDDVTTVLSLRNLEGLRQNCEKVELVLKCVFGDGNIANVGRRWR